MQITLTQTKDNQKIITDLTKIKDFSELSNSLSSIQPISSDNTTQLITYTLIATAVVGIFVYHYIKSQESLD
jgi:hypothetical protein